MLCNRILYLLEFVIIIVHAQKNQLVGVEHSPVLFLTDMENEFQIWEFFSHKMSPCTTLKFRDKFIYNVKIAGVPESVSHGQCLHFGLLQNIFKLMCLIGSVDCHYSCAYPCCCKHVCQPFRNILCPDSNTVSVFNPNSQHSFS